MEQLEVLDLFASRFVQKPFRERFVHEAMKKPMDLHRRICHDIENVFDTKYRDRTVSLNDEDHCLFLGWPSKLTTKTWKEAKEQMSSGGGGYLVIKADASSFYAETEAYPAVVYSSGS